MVTESPEEAYAGCVAGWGSCFSCKYCRESDTQEGDEGFMED